MPPSWTHAVIATSLAFPGLVVAQPLALVAVGTTMYRVNGGLVESFANQPGIAIAMTVVPPGVSVSSCVPGDVLATENTDGGRVWRVDNARAGTPQMVQIGQMPASVSVSDIGFAHGRLFGVKGGDPATWYEFDLTTFQQVGGAVVLLASDNRVGGLAFDGTANWYITNGATDNLIREPDPPTLAGWTIVGSAGVNFGVNDLEWFQGQLWGALRAPDNAGGRLAIGVFNVQTGAFTTVLDGGPVPDENLGFAALPRDCAQCYANCDCSGGAPLLTANDFSCFLNRFVAAESYANCDGSTSLPTLTANDFICFLSAYAAGCS